MKINKNILAILKKNNQGIKLDLGCGECKQEGFVGMDRRKIAGVDIIHDLEKFPWPLPDESCSVIMASHILEHIEPHNGLFIDVMNEAWRVIKPGGKFVIASPYANSPAFFQDPTHCNMLTEVTWEYFDPEAPNTKGELWLVYKPKPWKIIFNSWNEGGALEAVLVKRTDKQYVK